jgi:hypothetical protein
LPYSQGEFWVFFFWFFKTGFLYVALAVLELTLLSGWPRTQKSACPCLPSAGVKGMHHHRPTFFFFCLVGWLVFFFFFFFFFGKDSFELLILCPAPGCCIYWDVSLSSTLETECCELYDTQITALKETIWEALEIKGVSSWQHTVSTLFMALSSLSSLSDSIAMADTCCPQQSLRTITKVVQEPKRLRKEQEGTFKHTWHTEGHRLVGIGTLIQAWACF